MQHPREILGIGPAASPEDIKKAYRKLVREHHPDLGGSEASEERMKAINAAYDQIISGKNDRSEPDSGGFTAPRRPPTQGFGARGSDHFDRREKARDAAEFERQAREWTGNPEEFRARMSRGEEDLAYGAAAAQQARASFVNPDSPEARAAARRAEIQEIRHRREMRRNGLEIDPKEHRSTYAREAAPSRFNRQTAHDTQANAPLRSERVGAFGGRATDRIHITSSQGKAMDEVLDRARRAEAARRIRLERGGEQGETIEGFQKARNVRLKGRVMEIHLDRPAAAGVNAIAMPAFTQSGDSVTGKKEINLFQIRLDTAGGQTRDLPDASLMVSGAQDMKVQLVFPKARERARSADQQRA